MASQHAEPTMTFDDQFFSKYDTLITKTINRWQVPGISVAVTRGDSTWSKGYGIARSPDEKVTPTTLFNIGSMTKAFISSAISLLVDDDHLPDVKWTTPVSQLIRDDFVLSDSRCTEMVTVEDILSHRTGLPDQDNAFLGIYSKTPDNPKSVARKLRHLPLSAPLRTKYQYCNAMYVVATHLVESLTGIWIGDFLRQKIWEPLQMKETYFGVDDVTDHKTLHQLAKGYRWDETASSYVEVPWPIQPEGAGAGEMKSTVLDIASFLRCMIHKTSPLSPNAHSKLTKPRTIVNPEAELKPFHSHPLYALGWEIETYHGETVVGHDGCTNGFASKMLYLPRLEWGVVILGNKMDAYRAQEKICWTMIDDLLGVEEGKQFDWDGYWQKDADEPECKSKEELYPDLPETRIPLTLPMEKYVGEYRDEGYGTLAVHCEDGKLQVDARDRTWRFKLEFEHVSGEFFIVEMLDVDTMSRETLRAQFRIGADGGVSELGIAFVEELGDEKIWFQRVR